MRLRRGTSAARSNARPRQMPIRRTIIALLATAVALLLPGIALASSHSNVLRACAAGTLKLRLDVSHAENPGGGLSGTASALVTTELAELRVAADGVCPRSAPTGARAQAKHLLSLYRHGSRATARRALKRLLATSRTHAHKTSQGP